MSETWKRFYLSSAPRKGPYTLRELRRLIESRAISPFDLVHEEERAGEYAQRRMAKDVVGTFEIPPAKPTATYSFPATIHKEEQQEATHSKVLEPIRIANTEALNKCLQNTSEPKTNTKAMLNLTKATVLVLLMLFAGFILLSSLFDKKHSGPAIEYLVVYTTINDQFYEKEATVEDLNSAFVTFSDGTRVPWSAVKTKKMKVYADELTNALFQGQPSP